MQHSASAGLFAKTDAKKVSSGVSKGGVAAPVTRVLQESVRRVGAVLQDCHRYLATSLWIQAADLTKRATGGGLR